MKKLFILIMVFFTHYLTSGQIPEEFKYYCSMCDSSECLLLPESTICNNTSPYWYDNNLYLPSSGFENIYVKVNLIFLHKNNGDGMFTQGDPEHDMLINDLINEVNLTYSNLVNSSDPDCYTATGFLSHNKIQIVPNIIHINDEYGWNNENDIYPFCPSPPWYLDYLDNQITNNPNIPRGINVYCTETAWYYEELVVNQTTVDPGPINHACSQFPTTNDLDRSSRVHMPNLFTKYWLMKNIAPGIYNEPWDPVIRGWYIRSVGRNFAHELGHSFWLYHLYLCNWNLMNPSADYWESLFPYQIGKMHRSLSITNIRKFSTDESYISTPLLIQDNKLWDLDFTMYRDVIVEPGYTLTVSCKLVMKKNAKIIVKPGANLIVDGGIITTEDNSHWQGIEVWGDSDASQYTLPGQACAQGKLTLMNSAVIENAEIAVSLWRPTYYETTGGIIDASSESVFRNNTYSVIAPPYRNMHPTNPLVELDNFSTFENCTFEINSDYLDDNIFYHHIVLYWVKGIDFHDCDFIVDRDITGVSEYSQAIYAYDAGFSVQAICNAIFTPCPEEDWDKSEFTGFYIAILTQTDGSTSNTFLVNRAVFNDNIYGVKIEGVNNVVVLFSDFNIGENDVDVCCDPAGYGIFLQEATGFAFEENNFTKFPGASSGNFIGISINNTESSDEIYNNNFDNLSYANYSDGKNWGVDEWAGLTYFCNENANNYADFYVTGGPNSGIQNTQGDDDHVTGNTFSFNGTDWHFYNGGAHQVGYYYCDYCPNENPNDNLIYHVTDKGKSFDNSCASHYDDDDPDEGLVLPPQDKLITEQEYYSGLTDYNNVKVLYDNLVDGGSTSAELIDIQTAQPQDMWVLRSQLLGDSPHLSMEVLKAAADKTEVFTEAALFDILAANPDELKKEELMKYLEEKQDPLPAYMINILRSVASGTTYKTVLQQQMARYNRNKTRAAHDIIRSILSDSVTNNNELRNWLDNLGGLSADRQIIATYIYEDNFTDAFTLANMLPQLYSLEGDELIEHNYYIDILNLHYSLNQQGRNTMQLDSTEIANLALIANNSNKIASSQARSILEAHYGYHFVNCPQIDSTAGYKSSSNTMDALSKVYGLNISVKPNPAKQWAAFDYTLPENENTATITISDVSGKTIEVLQINGQQGQELWDTRQIKHGVYIYTLKVAGLSKSGKIIISE